MTMTKSSLTKVIHERKSVRKYDENFKIPQQQLEELLVEATSAPSSSNLQPWRFLVIQDEAVKKETKGSAGLPLSQIVHHEGQGRDQGSREGNNRGHCKRQKPG